MNIPKNVENKIRDYLYETNACINYPHLNGEGYGDIQVTIEGKKKHFLAHRVSYQICNNDDITAKDIICHKCDNPSCINPNHLFKGTHQDNVQDKVNKGRQASGSKNGRYIDGRASDNIVHKVHTHGAKLSIDQVKQIKEYKQKGIKLILIAKMLNVSYSTVRDISCGRAYKTI